MLSGIIGSLATAALVRMGKQLETVARSRSGKARSAREELAASQALSAFELSESLLRPLVDVPPNVSAKDVDYLLKSPEAESIAFEILVVVLSQSESAALERVRARWDSMLLREFPNERVFSGQLFEVLTEHYRIAAAVVSENFPQVYESLTADALHRRIACVLDVIAERVDPSVPVRVDMRALGDFQKKYKRVARDAHKDITPPDFESRRDVPIEELYVQPRITAAHSSSKADDDSVVVDLLAETDRTVLLGDPGNGKSTASQVLIYTTAKMHNAPIPFLVVLRDFAGDGIKRSVVEHVEDTLKTKYQCSPPSGAVEYLFDSGQAIVIFDGLDELLETGHRRDVTAAVENFCNRYPTIKVLVTSRRVGYAQAPMDRLQFKTLELSGFDRDQVREYVSRWFAQEDLEDGRVSEWTESFMQESESVSDLTSTPLLLALMCIIYRGERSIPRNRPAVYEKCATMLFNKWDGHRGIKADLQVGQQVDPAMKYLAYWLFTRDSVDGVPEADLINETTKYLHDRLFEDEYEARSAATEFVEFCRGRAWVFTDVGTTPEGERLYKFTHRTFMEYFAAYHLARLSETPEKLATTVAPRVANAEWDVVAQLAVQIIDKHSDGGANRVFIALLNEKRRRSESKRQNVIGFLIRCLTFAQVSPKTLRLLTSTVVSRTLEPDANRKSRYSGYGVDNLSLLLYNSQYTDQGTVEDELRNTLDNAVVSDDVEKSISAISLVSLRRVSLNIGIIPGISEQEIFSDWARWFEDFLSSHRELCLQRVPQSFVVAHECLDREWISLTQVLDQYNAGLNPLFARIRSSVVVDVEYMSIAEQLLYMAFMGRFRVEEEIAVQFRNQMEDVAAYAEQELETKGALVTAVGIDVRDHFGRKRSAVESSPDLSDTQLLGAAVLVAILVESRSDSDRLVELFLSDVRYRDLAALLRSRHTANAVPDPDGELARRGFGILIRWARSEVSFVG